MDQWELLLWQCRHFLKVQNLLLDHGMIYLDLYFQHLDPRPHSHFCFPHSRFYRFCALKPQQQRDGLTNQFLPGILRPEKPQAI